MKRLKIGSRGSKLALAQSCLIRDVMKNIDPGLEISIEQIKTTGDRFLDSSPRELAALTKGIFVKEIEEALLAGNIDLAVHSLKDLPVAPPPGLKIAAIPTREDPRDVAITTHPAREISNLPKGSRIATSSPRRSEQLKKLRPDFRIAPLRGNVDTRIRKLQTEKIDAIILAAAGLKRLGRKSDISFYLDPFQVVPAPGQGCLAIETLEHPDPELERLLEKLEDRPAREAVEAEKRFQMEAGAGCNFPLGAYAGVRNNSIFFSYYVGYPEKGRHISGTFFGQKGELGVLTKRAIERVKQEDFD